MGIVTADMACNCRQCHACAILGIAYPLARQPVDRPPDADPPRAERRPVAASIFDELDPEARR